MKKLLFLFLSILTLSANEILVKESACSVFETVKNFEDALKAKGLHVFAKINHSANAQAVGLQMRPTIMVVFGKAQLGTKLMQQDPRIGLDLPLRVLIYEDKDGKTKIAYRDGRWLANKHVVNAPKIIQKINKGMEDLTQAATVCKRR